MCVYLTVAVPDGFPLPLPELPCSGLTARACPDEKIRAHFGPGWCPWLLCGEESCSCELFEDAAKEHTRGALRPDALEVLITAADKHGEIRVLLRESDDEASATALPIEDGDTIDATSLAGGGASLPCDKALTLRGGCQ